MKAKLHQWAMCAKGTKSGWGLVERIVKRPDSTEMYYVHFPHRDYPETLMLISGDYLVYENDILEVRDSNYPAKAENND